MIIAYVREATGAYDLALYVIRGIMLVAAVILFFIHPPRAQVEARLAEEAEERRAA